jgi:hypothetical protein
MRHWSAAGAVVDRPADTTGGTPYARGGGAAMVRRAAEGFYRLVRGDRDLARLFAADPDALRWHQAAQLARVLGGPDWYPAQGLSEAYLPLVVPAAQYHRAGFYLVRAVDQQVAYRPAVVAVASALGARRCRIIAGLAASRAVAVMALESAGLLPPPGDLHAPVGRR